MDFLERLNDKINEVPNLPINSKLGYLGATESLVVYPLPGSQVINSYMDGTTDEAINYEIAMKSKSQEKISDTLWKVTRALEDTKEITSQDGSFEFDGLTITNLPYINQADEQGWYTFLVNLQARLTIKKRQ